jgi:hypothetical protein
MREARMPASPWGVRLERRIGAPQQTALRLDRAADGGIALLVQRAHAL